MLLLVSIARSLPPRLVQNVVAQLHEISFEAPLAQGEILQRGRKKPQKGFRLNQWIESSATDSLEVKKRSLPVADPHRKVSPAPGRMGFCHGFGGTHLPGGELTLRISH